MSADKAVTVASPSPPTTPVQNTAPSGLTSDAASSRLQKDGLNAMPDTSVHPLRNALAKFWAPVPWLQGLQPTGRSARSDDGKGTNRWALGCLALRGCGFTNSSGRLLLSTGLRSCLFHKLTFPAILPEIFGEDFVPLSLIGISALMVVPLPDAELTPNLPPIISTRSRDPKSPRRLCRLAKRTFSTSKDLPLSWISIRMDPGSLRTLTVASVAPACLCTLVSADWAMR